jgi:molybdopterin adenylyltransferase
LQAAGVFAAVPYCIDLIGGPYCETDDTVCKAFRPKTAQRPRDTLPLRKHA